MKFFTKSFFALAALVMFAAPAFAADGVAKGKIKQIFAEKKELVLTDDAGMDLTIKLGENLVINRGGKETLNDLMVGDPVNVCYDKGIVSWTAHYILVREGDTKDCSLVHGTIKNYDADTKKLIFTDQQSKDWSFPMGSAKVRLNKEESKIADVKIGDHALAIVHTMGDDTSLKCLMIVRK